MNEFIIQEIRSIDELIEILKKNSIDYDYDLINRSYEFACSKHSQQKRLTGDDFVIHLLTVAGYIGRLKLDTVSVCAALLHDVLEKAECDIDELDKEFGTEIAFIVEGLSKMRDYSKKFDKNEKQEEFTNLIFNSSEDIRIIIIRLAEKLHNIVTIDLVDDKVRQNAARKALYIYAPLAEYLGLGVIQRLLEDYSFKVIHPKEYDEIEKSKEAFFKSKQNVINEFEEEIRELLSEYNINKYEIYSREKGTFSAYKKLKNKYKYIEKGESVSDAIKNHLKDIYAARIIVNDIESCYIVLGLIQANFDTLQEEFTDYIAHPKDNGYKSIHVLFKFQDIVLEVQIRTYEMHEHAEFGPASHIAYKLQNKNSSSMTWTKDLVGWKEKTSLKKEDFKLKAFQNSIFCFTPKGMVISLPKDASPIDFAYRVHTDVGDRYNGALVNNKMVSMDHKLQTGDIVEIKTKKDINVRRDWLNHAKSTSTRARIRRRIRTNKK